MKILVLGGTLFLGRHIVEIACEVGHEVTLFNRGTKAELFPDLEKLRGDRDGDLSALEGREWDCVIDTCGYVPRIVSQSVHAMLKNVKQYIFVSTISVYSDTETANQNESAPVCKISDESIEEVTGETYGALKALCENVVREAFKDNALMVRPGLIVGPHDQTDRFTYWPVRIAQYDTVLTPPLDTRIEFVDVRDLAKWILLAAESSIHGTFNVSGPSKEKCNLSDLLEVCESVSNRKAKLIEASNEELLERGVAQWTDLPLWIAGEVGQSTHSSELAIAAGLQFRPVSETVSDTLNWAGENINIEKLSAGISREREMELIEDLSNSD